MKRLRGLVLAMTLLPVGAALAQVANDVELDHGSVWETRKDGATTQGFLQIHNTSNVLDQLNSVSCPIADSTDLVDANGKVLPKLDIPAGQTVILTEKGPHLVLKDLHYKVQFGSIVPCSFMFQNVGAVGGYLNSAKAPKS